MINCNDRSLQLCIKLTELRNQSLKKIHALTEFQLLASASEYMKDHTFELRKSNEIKALK